MSTHDFLEIILLISNIRLTDKIQGLNLLYLGRYWHKQVNNRSYQYAAICNVLFRGFGANVGHKAVSSAGIEEQCTTSSIVLMIITTG
jgi:hypothetical protein